MDYAEVEKAGEYGSRVLICFGYNTNLLGAMREILKNDDDIVKSKLEYVNIREKQSIAPAEYVNTDVKELVGPLYDVYIEQCLWGRIRFLPTKYK